MKDKPSIVIVTQGNLTVNEGADLVYAFTLMKKVDEKERLIIHLKSSNTRHHGRKMEKKGALA
jgi:hypothetical protein